MRAPSTKNTSIGVFSCMGVHQWCTEGTKHKPSMKRHQCWCLFVFSMRQSSGCWKGNDADEPSQRLTV